MNVFREKISNSYCSVKQGFQISSITDLGTKLHVQENKLFKINKKSRERSSAVPCSSLPVQVLSSLLTLGLIKTSNKLLVDLEGEKNKGKRKGAR